MLFNVFKFDLRQIFDYNVYIISYLLAYSLISYEELQNLYLIGLLQLVIELVLEIYFLLADFVISMINLQLIFKV